MSAPSLGRRIALVTSLLVIAAIVAFTLWNPAASGGLDSAGDPLKKPPNGSRETALARDAESERAVGLRERVDSSVHVHVVDESGEPVIGASVWPLVVQRDQEEIDLRFQENGELEVEGAASTNDSGVALLMFPEDGLKSGLRMAVVSSPGYAPALERVPISRAEQVAPDVEVQVVLQPACSQGVEVLKSGGGPILGASVEFAREWDSDGTKFKVRFTSLSDGEGVARVPLPTVGTYLLSVRCPGFVSTVARAVQISRESLGENLRVELSKSGRLNGSVETLGREPVSGARILCLREEREKAEWAYFKFKGVATTSDDSGEFAVDGLVAGVPHSLLSVEGCRWALLPGLIPPCRVWVQMPVVAPVTGTVVGSAVEANALRLELINMDVPKGIDAASSTKLDSSGRFSVMAMPGRFKLRIVSKESLLLLERTIEVGPGGLDLGELALEPSGALRIVVLPGAPAETLDSYAFHLISPVRTPLRRVSNIGNESAAEQGNEANVYTQLSPGTYTLRVFANEFHEAHVEVMIEAGVEYVARVELVPRCSVEIQVVDLEQHPVSGVTIFLRKPGIIEHREPDKARTNQDGVATLTGVIPGVYEVVAILDFGKISIGNIDVSRLHTQEKLELSLLEDLTLVVVDRDGPVVGGWVSVFFVGESEVGVDKWYGQVLSREELGPDGAIHLEGIPRGAYLARARQMDGRMWEERIEFSFSGQVVTLVQPSHRISGSVIPVRGTASVRLLWVKWVQGNFSERVARDLLLNSDYSKDWVFDYLNGGWTGGRPASVSESGKFAFEGLGPGDYFLIAIDEEGWSSVMSRVSIATADVSGVQLELQEKATLVVSPGNIDTLLVSEGLESVSIEVWEGDRFLVHKWLGDKAITLTHLPAGMIEVRVTGWEDVSAGYSRQLFRAELQLSPGMTEKFEWPEE
jgi:hypothetical protein